MKHAIQLTLALALVGCTSTTAETVNQRADGLSVECTEVGDGAHLCDPQEDQLDPDEDIALDEVTTPIAEGLCLPWTEGGPALMLWPPNHKMHSLSLAGCRAASECRGDEAIDAGAGELLFVTSDEPVDVGRGGDGHTTEFDIEVSAGEVSLRAERQGGGDGRVYTLHYRLDGDDSGATRACEVHVPHDQGPHGGAIDSGEAVRVEL